MRHTLRYASMAHAAISATLDAADAAAALMLLFITALRYARLLIRPAAERRRHAVSCRVDIC